VRFWDLFRKLSEHQTTGNLKRGTARPTTERMLVAVEGIDLFVLLTEIGTQCFLTQLSAVQKRILALGLVKVYARGSSTWTAAANCGVVLLQANLAL
jgi:hypothetical protein